MQWTTHNLNQLVLQMCSLGKLSDSQRLYTIIESHKIVHNSLSIFSSETLCHEPFAEIALSFAY